MTLKSVDGLTPPELLHYLPTYRVLICRRCSYAIQPGAVARHLKEIHHLHHSSRRAFIDYASRFELTQPNDVVLPDETQFPVPLLPVQNGLACSFARCAHLCVTIKRMKQHWMTVHHIAASDNGGFWDPVPLQSFFRGNAFRYFTNPALLISSSSSASSDGLTSTAVTTPASRSNHGESSPLQPLITTDVGLLDHYQNHTYKILTCGPETDDAFRIIVPQLGTQFPFLLHGILSCSALHLAFIDPPNRVYYTIQSIRHQNQAAPAFRWATMHVDSNNSQAVLAFAFFLVVYTLGSQSNDEPLFLSNDDNPEDAPSSNWIEILRNGCSMLCPVWTELSAGPLAPFTTLWREDLGITADPNDPLLITLLSVIPDRESNSAESSIYRDSAVKLAVAFAFIKNCGPSPSIWDALNSWPMRVSPDYLSLLKQNNPGALLLLSYYAILLQPLRGEWFLEGRVIRLVDEIARRLRGNCSAQIWEVFSTMREEYFSY
ncbi:transcriptional regulator family: Fungal Specific TF [Penicillium psychrosexuale]|uniref:transcriptional regulator family: Fungal Specific TF n=1 Tax=Penicillium psychrosexuale TaxID=1002107 RepID=UPI002544DE01|nr:transcriptional regulator family: Fungal Specific TF [Penicillium psychrosexuale]KAJ5783894.1 transcriptional regulator family: Fungal Specific TF [Penicillium psychrosexuale]